MSTVSSVNGFNTNTRFTKKGNAYQKTNLGKNIGTAVGVALGAGYAIRNREVFGQLANSIKEAGSALPKHAKVCIAADIALGIGLYALRGLVIGAIGDAIANKVKANKADKAAKAE